VKKGSLRCLALAPLLHACRLEAERSRSLQRRVSLAQKRFWRVNRCQIKQRDSVFDAACCSAAAASASGFKQGAKAEVAGRAAPICCCCSHFGMQRCWSRRRAAGYSIVLIRNVEHCSSQPSPRRSRGDVAAESRNRYIRWWQRYVLL
jgi:hypothetical protein